MKTPGNPYLNLCILSIFVILIISQSANAITIEELADTCEKMEKAYEDITVDYEWAVKPPATIEDLKKDGIGGLLTIGPEKCSFSTKVPFDKRMLYKSNEKLMNEEEKTFKEIRIDSYDGKTAKHFTQGALCPTGEQVDISFGVITERKDFLPLLNVTPLSFTIFRMRYAESEKISIPECLRKNEVVSINDSIKKVNDFNTVNIELLWDVPDIPLIHKKQWKYCIYFSVDHGYTPVKFEQFNPSESGPKLIYAVNITALKKVSDNLWFPSKGYLGSPANNLINTYNASKIIVNQGLTDKDFDIKFPLGTRITDETTGFGYVQAENEMQLLAGKSLPDLSSFGIELQKKEIENKRILICFFDMEQRPSRNDIIELNKKAQELKSQNVETITVQSSKIEQAKLDEWIKEYGIAFPVGMIKENEEQIKFNWSVKALPWLILTDKEHVVTAEGFSMNELDENIEIGQNQELRI